MMIIIAVDHVHIPAVVAINFTVQHNDAVQPKLDTKPYGVSVLKPWLCPTGHGRIEVQQGEWTLAGIYTRPSA
jgi:hypothetical protein